MTKYASWQNMPNVYSDKTITNNSRRICQYAIPKVFILQISEPFSAKYQILREHYRGRSAVSYWNPGQKKKEIKKKFSELEDSFLVLFQVSQDILSPVSDVCDGCDLIYSLKTFTAFEQVGLKQNTHFSHTYS